MRVIPMGRTSERVLRCCALLGFGVGEGFGNEEQGGDEALELQAQRVLRLLKAREGACGRVFLTGPSGSGKSRLLRTVFRAMRSNGSACVMVEDPRACLERHADHAAIELFDCTIEQALGILSGAGLCEARCIVQPLRMLSEGERWRVVLALGMQEALATLARESGTGHPCVLCVDEFGGVLDETTARCVALGVARWAARVGVAILAAGPRPIAGRWLCARVIDVRHGKGET